MSVSLSLDTISFTWLVILKSQLITTNPISHVLIIWFRFPFQSPMDYPLIPWLLFCGMSNVKVILNPHEGVAHLLTCPRVHSSVAAIIIYSQLLLARPFQELTRVEMSTVRRNKLMVSGGASAECGGEESREISGARGKGGRDGAPGRNRSGKLVTEARVACDDDAHPSGACRGAIWAIAIWGLSCVGFFLLHSSCAWSGRRRTIVAYGRNEGYPSVCWY